MTKLAYKNLVAVMDFGGQYAQLIARRIRDLNVYCEIIPYSTKVENLEKYKGIIFTGGPNSVYNEASPQCSAKVFSLGIPVLGICYGAQMMAHALGGVVKAADVREYGKCEIEFTKNSKIFGELGKSQCWMSHTDYIEKLPPGFKISATTQFCPCAAMEWQEKSLYAVQFHPEVEHTPCGNEILSKFLFKVCKCERDWQMSSFTKTAIENIKEQVGSNRVICGLSGGVDSSVAALLVHRAIGENLTCIFVDHGMLRKGEGDLVETVFKKEFNMNIIRVNAKEQFLSKLKGVTLPEKKREIIGEEFVKVFEEQAQKLGGAEFLCQGTIYPDVVESGVGQAAVIKSHHNVGGLPEKMGFKGIVEPLRDLFKDEVRKAGIELGIKASLVWRQPFPGPGLAVRIIGEITKEKLKILKEADAIFREEIVNEGLDRSVNQYFAVLTGSNSVGVIGDARTYGEVLCLRAVTTTDFMTADWAKLPYELLAKTSNRIVNEVKGISRVLYDITSKPPATIEWE